MRYWSVAEARDYLPRLRELITAVREAVAVATRSQNNGHGGAKSSIGPAEALEELAKGDIELRDAERGLVDFHALGADGVVYLLCWQLGEDDLAWWHLPEEGFAGRKRLPRNESGS